MDDYTLSYSLFFIIYFRLRVMVGLKERKERKGNDAIARARSRKGKKKGKRNLILKSELGLEKKGERKWMEEEGRNFILILILISFLKKYKREMIWDGILLLYFLFLLSSFISSSIVHVNKYGCSNRIGKSIRVVLSFSPII